MSKPAIRASLHRLLRGSWQKSKAGVRLIQQFLDHLANLSKEIVGSDRNIQHFTILPLNSQIRSSPYPLEFHAEQVSVAERLSEGRAGHRRRIIAADYFASFASFA